MAGGISMALCNNRTWSCCLRNASFTGTQHSCAQAENIRNILEKQGIGLVAERAEKTVESKAVVSPVGTLLRNGYFCRVLYYQRVDLTSDWLLAFIKLYGAGRFRLVVASGICPSVLGACGRARVISRVLLPKQRQAWITKWHEREEHSSWHAKAIREKVG